MKEKGKYQINDAFIITGRGLVFAGIISDGSINTGDYLVFNFNGKELSRQITGTNIINTQSSESNLSLMIKTTDEKKLIALKNWEPNSIEAHIYAS